MSTQEKGRTRYNVTIACPLITSLSIFSSSYYYYSFFGIYIFFPDFFLDGKGDDDDDNKASIKRVKRWPNALSFSAIQLASWKLFFFIFYSILFLKTVKYSSYSLCRPPAAGHQLFLFYMYFSFLETVFFSFSTLIPSLEDAPSTMCRPVAFYSEANTVSLFWSMPFYKSIFLLLFPLSFLIDLFFSF